MLPVKSFMAEIGLSELEIKTNKERYSRVSRLPHTCSQLQRAQEKLRSASCKATFSEVAGRYLGAITIFGHKFLINGPI